MKADLKTMFAIVVFLLCHAFLNCQEIQPQHILLNPGDVVPGELLISLDISLSDNNLADFFQAYNKYDFRHAGILWKSSNLFVIAARYNPELSKEMETSFFSELLKDPLIKGVERNAILEQRESQAYEPETQTKSPTRNYPLDIDYSSLGELLPPNNVDFPIHQWSLKNTGQLIESEGNHLGVPGADIKATYAWKLLDDTPHPKTHEIVIATIDKGFRLSATDNYINWKINTAERDTSQCEYKQYHPNYQYYPLSYQIYGPFPNYSCCDYDGNLYSHDY